MNIISTQITDLIEDKNITVNDSQIKLGADAVVELEEGETVGSVKDELRMQGFKRVVFVRFVEYTSNLNREQLSQCSLYSTKNSGMAFNRECVCSVDYEE